MKVLCFDGSGAARRLCKGPQEHIDLIIYTLPEGWVSRVLDDTPFAGLVALQDPDLPNLETFDAAVSGG